MTDPYFQLDTLRERQEQDASALDYESAAILKDMLEGHIFEEVEEAIYDGFDRGDAHIITQIAKFMIRGDEDMALTVCQVLADRFKPEFERVADEMAAARMEVA